MSGQRLTKQQREAMDMLHRHGGDGIGVSTRTWEDSYGGGIHWRTAQSLERMGLVVVDSWSDEEPGVYLPTSGERDAS